MRVVLVLAVLVAAVLVCEGRHRKRKERTLGVPYAHHGSKHGKHRGGKLNKHAMSLDIKTLDDDDWMKLPKKSKECKTIKCPSRHFCLTITDPDSQKEHEKCVSYKNFRQGRRLFRSYHRQKAMLEKKGKMSDLMSLKLQKAEKMKDVYDLLGDYKKSLSHGKHAHKLIDMKTISKEIDPKNVKEADPATLQECRPNEIYQLRQRLVGWFVLLHTESRQHHHQRASKLRATQSHAHASRKHPKHDPLGIDKPAMDKFYKLDMLDKHRVLFDGHTGGKGHHSKHHGKVDKHHPTLLDNHHARSKRMRRAAVPEIDVEQHGNCKCSKSVMWQFHVMDSTPDDGHLNHEELASIESIKREPCLKPLIKSCDTDGDGNLSRGEFCCCMRDTVPPCAEKQRLGVKTDWEPKCDKEGYFEREQCTKTGYCWCVDIDGNTIADTKVFGSAHCGKYDPNGKLIKA